MPPSKLTSNFARVLTSWTAVKVTVQGLDGNLDAGGAGGSQQSPPLVVRVMKNAQVVRGLSTYLHTVQIHSLFSDSAQCVKNFCRVQGRGLSLRMLSLPSGIYAVH